MADPKHRTPHAEQLAAELRSLHDRRERGPLSAEEEARYAELWTWWQAVSDLGAEAEPAGEAPQAAVPEEWLEALGGEEAAASPSAANAPAKGDAGDDLVSEWEAWQASRSGCDPFDLVPDDEAAGGSYEEVMRARAAVLGGEGFFHADRDDAPDALGDAIELEVGESPVASEAPAPEAPARPLQAPATVPLSALQGARRVVIHLADGQVRRGQVMDVEPYGENFTFVGASGATESVPRAQVRTAFYMQVPGAAPPPAHGDRVRVVLVDGRELTGKSADHACGGDGFTVAPELARSNAVLVWVSRAAVKRLSVEA